MAKFRITFKPGTGHADRKMIDAVDYKINGDWFFFSGSTGNIVATVASGQISMVEEIPE
ncbi:MAG: hypothetical protein Q8K86_08745 [Candidatus Nanopelagicaceae bacterium]|nr:hypothetical protein [Candidatus Nanopelagicaceae bacterium]